MAVILFDTEFRKRLYPLTYTRAVADLRFGLFSIKERWHRLLEEEIFIESESYLQVLYLIVEEGNHTWINASVLPDSSLVEAIQKMRQGDVLEDKNGIIACRGKGSRYREALEVTAMNFIFIQPQKWINYPHELLRWNESFLHSDFVLLTNNRESQPLPATVQCLHPQNVFIEEGATIQHSIINAESGPVYFGKDVTVMEGCLLKGPLALGEGTVVKMGAKLYGAISTGKQCTLGGEIKNSILHSYSNKAHDGYMGDSIIGEWCNWGAGATNSNVKNTAGNVMLWNEHDKGYVNAGNKFGAVMGDYTRVAINASINTGSVYGVSCNVFGEGLLPTRLRNFSWGSGGVGYAIDKAIKHIRQWKNFKQQSLTAEEESVLSYIFDNFINL